MTKTVRARYTREFKQEAVRLVQGGQSIAAAARSLGVVEQTLFNWVKAQRAGPLKGADSSTLVSVEQRGWILYRARYRIGRVLRCQLYARNSTANAALRLGHNSTKAARHKCEFQRWRVWFNQTNIYCGLVSHPSAYAVYATQPIRTMGRCERGRL
jgi:transposase-like protein